MSLCNSLFEQDWQHTPGSKISNAPKNNSFVASFMPLKLRRDCMEDYIRMGESKIGIGLQQDYMRSSMITAYFKGV